MHVLMVVKSGVLDDARVRREALTLRDAGHRVSILGDRPPPGTGSHTPPPGIDVRWVRPAGATATTAGRARAHVPAWLRWILLPTHRRREERAFARLAVSAGRQVTAVDVVHAHDLSALGAGDELRRHHRARLVYDAHECWTGRALEGRPTPFADRADRRREHRLGSTADAVLTVSAGLAAWFRRTYSWEQVTVVANSFPGRTDPSPVPAPRGLLYAGRIDRKRDLHTVAALASARPDLRVTVMGAGDEVLAGELRGCGLEVRDPLGIDEVDAVYRAHGVALVTLAAGSLNHQLALPNKVFHAVRAGVPVVAASLPELAGFVGHHRIGATYEPGDVHSLGRAVDEVVAHYDRYRAAVVEAGSQLTWDHDAARLREVYDRLDGAHR